ncbi:MAG TPA: transcription elongation factor Spt5 [Nitrososphaera sp.]|nr:transcription elongation factor Spt5 [Nitrososphaera sp.]
MKNRIEGAQEDGNGQEEIEIENDTIENSNFVGQQVSPERDTTTSSEERLIVKPSNESEGEEPTSAVKPAANSPSVSPAGVPSQPNRVVLSSGESKFFAIRTTGGQERVVANMVQTRANAKKLLIRSIIVLDSFKGYIIVEAPDSNVAYEALAGIRHVRGQIRGDLPFKDIEGYLVKKPVVSELSTNDTVEVIAGPFKSMKAKITRVDYEKQEATVVLLDSPYQIPVTVDANYLKKLAH